MGQIVVESTTSGSVEIISGLGFDMEKSGFGFATRSIGSKQKWNVSRYGWRFPGGGCTQPAGTQDVR